MENTENKYPVKRPWLSLSSVLFVQTQNAFNDNFLKFVLISLAGVVAKDHFIGQNAQRILTGFIPLAFIIFSPVAGFLSDRYSKRNVLFWCIVAQLFILGFTIWGIKAELLWVGIFSLFLLSIQSTFFSPSKQGILKELVGSRKLTVANGMLQMLTMVAILAGGWLGGKWFGQRQGALGDPWQAALIPVVAISMAALIPLLLRFVVDKTPAHISTKFKPVMLIRHFQDLGELFKSLPLTRSSVGVAYYWLVASFLGVLIFDWGKTVAVDVTSGRAATTSSNMFATIGVGLMAGSILVAMISRNGINLRLAQLGGIGLTIAIGLLGVLAVESKGFYVTLGVLGFWGAFFLVPLSSYLQDIAPNEKRGRIMAASAVLVSICSVGSILFSFLFTQLKIDPSRQMLFFVVPTIAVTWYISGLINYRESRENQ